MKIEKGKIDELFYVCIKEDNNVIILSRNKSSIVAKLKAIKKLKEMIAEI
jgi:hypothetical protein